MYKDYMALVAELKNYASPKARLTRMIRNGEVIRVRRSIFLQGDDDSYSLKSLGTVMYGPSYISFEYALSFYGLIPERVSTLTLAAYNKNKNKILKTAVGDFYYYYLPNSAYPYGIVKETENSQPYLIATAEKAVCDALYKTRRINSSRDLEILLFDDWRMDFDSVLNLDYESLSFLAPLYQRKIHKLLVDWYNREKTNA